MTKLVGSTAIMEARVTPLETRIADLEERLRIQELQLAAILKHFNFSPAWLANALK